MKPGETRIAHSNSEISNSANCRYPRLHKLAPFIRLFQGLLDVAQMGIYVNPEACIR